MRTLLLLITAAQLLFAAAPTPLAGQESAESPRRLPHRILYTAYGALFGLATGLLIANTGDDARCFGPTCIPTIGTALGAAGGYLIGRASDRRHETRFRFGAPLRPPATVLRITGEPLLVAALDSIVAVATTSGVHRLIGRATAVSALRATGLRRLETLDLLPPDGALVLGSQAGLYLFPPGEGPGRILREGSVAAVATAAGAVFSASGPTIERLIPGADNGVRARIDLEGAVRALAFDPRRNVLWISTESALVGVSAAGDSLALLASLPTRGPARGMVVEGDHLALALGAAGFLLLDISDVHAPRERLQWTGARFAYDVALDADRAFLAAGAEGVYVFGLSGETPALLGLARALGFAVALASDDGYTYVIDRSGSLLRRIPSAF